MFPPVSFKKPFRAVPLKRNPRFRPSRPDHSGSSVGRYIGGSIIAGAFLGIGSLAAEGTLSPDVVAGSRSAAASVGLVRASDPPPGAYYSGCNEARAAGVAPLYIGEPGYRPQMDGDSDGIACEPYR